jgi:hypothetical protein
MNRRPGVTLIEVLVAIFVTGVGLLSLLALFPVGAFSMANAIKNGRCVQASANSKGVAASNRIWTDSSVSGSFTTPGGALPGISSTSPPASPFPYTGPSYPVYVDPIGTSLSSSLGGFNFTAYGYTSPGMPRVSLSFISGATVPTSAALRWMSLTDDITFNLDGTPTEPIGTSLVQREDRYSWAYVLQQPSWGASNQINVTTVVYAGRSSVVTGETSYGTDSTGPGIKFIQGSNTVDVSWDPGIGQSQPNIKNGTWILDATQVRLSPTVPGTIEVPPEGPHAYFYRVVNTTLVPNPGPSTLQTMTLELQSRIVQSTVYPPGTPLAGGNYGVLVVMDNVAEVFGPTLMN